MRKTIKTEQDGLTLFQRIKAAADHHAHTVNEVIDHLFEAIKQYKDSDSVSIFTSHGMVFKAGGSIYRLSYNNDKISLSNSEQSENIIAEFDNMTSKDKVMEVFQNLRN